VKSLSPIDAGTIPAPATPSVNGDAKRVGKQFESFFMGYLMKTMQQSTSQGSSFEKGVYQDMFTQQVADQAAEHTPLGIGTMIEKALTHNAPAAPATAATTGAGFNRVTSPYGMRQHPITGETQFHHGIDLAAPTGTPVPAASAGQVAFSGSKDGFGEVVEVEQAGTTQIYAHLSQRSVATGDTVTAGQNLGQVGQSGVATGPHLHFEVRANGRSVDPAPWVGNLTSLAGRPK
jgi:murein DD-endopeptidase MepM/ murein hydrolase activator NlpD